MPTSRYGYVCRLCGWSNAPYVFTDGLCRECQRDVATMQRIRTRCGLCQARFVPSSPRQDVCHNCRDGHHVLSLRRAKRQEAALDRQMRARAEADPAYRAAVNALRSLAPSLYGYEEL